MAPSKYSLKKISSVSFALLALSFFHTGSTAFADPDSPGVAPLLLTARELPPGVEKFSIQTGDQAINEFNSYLISSDINPAGCQVGLDKLHIPLGADVATATASYPVSVDGQLHSVKLSELIKSPQYNDLSEARESYFNSLCMHVERTVQRENQTIKVIADTNQGPIPFGVNAKEIGIYYIDMFATVSTDHKASQGKPADPNGKNVEPPKAYRLRAIVGILNVRGKTLIVSLIGPQGHVDANMFNNTLYRAMNKIPCVSVFDQVCWNWS